MTRDLRDGLAGARALGNGQGSFNAGLLLNTRSLGAQFEARHRWADWIYGYGSGSALYDFRTRRGEMSAILGIAGTFK